MAVLEPDTGVAVLLPSSLGRDTKPTLHGEETRAVCASKGYLMIFGSFLWF